MTKAEMLADPNSCWNKAKDDEPVFILLGRDPEGPETVDYWSRKRRERKGKAADAECLDAFYVAGSMIQYGYKQEKKTEQPVVTVIARIGGSPVRVQVYEEISKAHGSRVTEVRQLRCKFLTDVPRWFLPGTEFAIYSDELKGNFKAWDNNGMFFSNGVYELTPKQKQEATYERSDPRD